MKRIPLTRGFETVVDDGDYEYLSQWKWHVATTKGNGKVYASRKGRICDGERRMDILMHRVILNVGPDRRVDHRNGDGLDNRRSNLRAATDAENGYNSRPKGRSSRYKGVTYHIRSAQWRARIARDGATYHLGSFTNEHAAAAAYNVAAQMLFGEFAWLNEIKPEDLLVRELARTAVPA